MKAIAIIFGTILALAATFVGMPMLFLDWRPQRASKPPAIARVLTSANATRSTNLPAIDRKDAVAQCLATFNKERKPGVIDAENTAKLRHDLADWAETACDCIVNDLEDKTDTLTFVLAMSLDFVVASELQRGSFSIGDPEHFRGVKPIAEKLGISNREFDQASIRALDSIQTSIAKCRQS